MSFELRYSRHLFHHLIQLERIKMHSVALKLGSYVSDVLKGVGNCNLEDFISLAALKNLHAEAGNNQGFSKDLFYLLLSMLHLRFGTRRYF